MQFVFYSMYCVETQDIIGEKQDTAGDMQGAVRFLQDVLYGITGRNW